MIKVFTFYTLSGLKNKITKNIKWPEKIVGCQIHFSREYINHKLIMIYEIYNKYLKKNNVHIKTRKKNLLYR